MATLNGEPLVEAPSFAEAGPGADPERDFETRLEPDVVQQLTRREARDGGQWLCGLVRVRFDAGQRTGHAHVAFCPPFLSTPSCEAEPVDGPDSVVKVAQLVPHGARFEARLDVPAAEPTDVVVEFATHWQPDSGVGATET
jgi:hypothetical protein